MSQQYIYSCKLQGNESAPKKSRGSSQVFLDIKIGNKQTGRIVIELRPDIVPKTAGKYITFVVTTQIYWHLSQLFPTCMMQRQQYSKHGWMDGLQLYIIFNNISVLSG